ncbi:MAG: IclR family transcriptional regulator, partial [Oscillospiraceae bacterium]
MPQNAAPQKSGTPVNSIGRALDILEYLTYSLSTPVGISEISRYFDINRTTTYNLVSSLMEKGYVGKTLNGKYTVTSRLFELGTVFQNSFSLVHLVKRSVFPLPEGAKCTSKLTILADNMRAVIIFSRSNEDDLSQLPLGYSFPLHTSASGKVLLAHAPQVVLDNYIASTDLKRYTENTITDKAMFLEELSKVKENGFAVDNCEYTPDQICLSAPVINNMGTIAAISVSGRVKMMEKYRDQILPDLLSYTYSLSLESGYVP